MGHKKELPGEPVDRAALVRSLARLGVRSDDPYRGGRISEVYLMLTMDCNLRCRACSLWGVRGACRRPGYYRRGSRPIGEGRLLEFVDSVAAFGPSSINLTGGEPLLRRFWRPLARRARGLGLKTVLTTNGVLIEKSADEIAECFDQVSVSIAAPPLARERLRLGPPGHYAAMVRGLRRLVSLRDSSPSRRPVLRLLCEVFDGNAGRLGAIVESLEREGVVFDEILFQHLIFNSPRTLARQELVLRREFGLASGLWKGYGYRPGAMDFKAFHGELARLGRRYPRASFSVDLRGLRRLRDYYQGRRGRLGRPFCDAPWTQVNLLPNGDVWVCPDMVLGNIREKDFAEIWDGPMARALRRRVSRRLFPACRGCFYFYGKERPAP